MLAARRVDLVVILTVADVGEVEGPSGGGRRRRGRPCHVPLPQTAESDVLRSGTVSFVGNGSYPADARRGGLGSEIVNPLLYLHRALE